MIDESKEERASLYVLGMLETADAAQFQEEMRADAELRELVVDLEEVIAALAHDAPPEAPPAQVRSRLITEIRGERASGPGATEARARRSFLPWALAASLAVIASLLAYERSQLRRDVVALRDKDAFSTLRIATLSSQLNGTNGVGAIAWNGQAQRGMLKLEKMPPLEQNQDYQLWVIDPRYPQPVSGGIVHVDDEGNARLTFTVEVPITNADKFAISRERKGGAPQAEGPIVMLSN
jgi:anti-sigma-K factor RskA